MTNFFTFFVLFSCVFRRGSPNPCLSLVEACLLIAMSARAKGKEQMTTQEDTVSFGELVEDSTQGSTLCLIGRVLSNKPFNTFGFLEAMKKSMNPPKGFTVREVGPNLFSFQFKEKMI